MLWTFPATPRGHDVLGTSFLVAGADGKLRHLRSHLFVFFLHSQATRILNSTDTDITLERERERERGSVGISKLLITAYACGRSGIH